MSTEAYERGLCERVAASLRRQWPDVRGRDSSRRCPAATRG